MNIYDVVFIVFLGFVFIFGVRLYYYLEYKNRKPELSDKQIMKLIDALDEAAGNHGKNPNWQPFTDAVYKARKDLMEAFKIRQGR